MFSIVPVSVTSNQSQCSHPTCHRASASSWSWPPWPPPPWRGSGAPWASGPALPPVSRWDRPVASVTRRETASAVRSQSGQRMAINWHYQSFMFNHNQKLTFTNFSVWAIWRIFFHLDVILEKHSVKQPATLLAGPEASVLRTATTVSFMMIIDDDDIDNNFGRWMWWHIFVPIRVCPVCSGEHL